MKQIHFTVPGKPFGKQRPRVACRGKFSKAYTPKETIAYENLVKLFYAQEANGEMFPVDAELAIKITAYYEIPAKVIYDSLNMVAYHDDAAIVEARISKFYSDYPRVEVTIKQIEY